IAPTIFMARTSPPPPSYKTPGMTYASHPNLGRIYSLSRSAGSW
nr:hypothetical protein [Tanacetum cinerariifolium]